MNRFEQDRANNGYVEVRLTDTECDGMPTWSEILHELRDAQQPGYPPDFDGVRRKYLGLLHQHTGRNVILYASGWLQKQRTQADVSINDDDIQAFMEVSHDLEDNGLDLILHSPGGSPEAAEAIVSYLRSRFSHIRVIVPNLAMSAATMISCAADEIVLGKHSFLGPTDPQIWLLTPLGFRMTPAQAILDQFDRARRECADPNKLSVWLPMLHQYGPDLLTQCESALKMSKILVEDWLRSWMFGKLDDGPKKAKGIAKWLANHKNFRSHSRHISRDEIESRQLEVVRLESDEKLQDLALSVFHATTHTFSRTPSVKIVESHIGRAYIRGRPAPPMPPVPHGMIPVVPEPGQNLNQSQFEQSG